MNIDKYGIILFQLCKNKDALNYSKQDVQGCEWETIRNPRSIRMKL